MNYLIMPTLMQRNMCYHYSHFTNEGTEAQWDYVACPIYIARGCRSRTKSLSTWLPWQLSGKESTCNAGHAGLIRKILGQKDTLEEEIVTHSSILVLRIPWTEEPGRLQSIGLQSQTCLSSHTHTHTVNLSIMYCELILIVTMQL